MKITKEHYEAIENAMRPIMDLYPYNGKSGGNAGFKSAGWSIEKYGWTIYWHVNSVTVTGCAIHNPTTFVCNVLYRYLNDSHIETALRRIVKNHIKSLGE